MTTFQIIFSAVTWIAAVAAVIGAALSFRAQQQAQAALVAVRVERRTSYIPGGGELTFNPSLSDAEVDQIKAHWLERHGKAGAAGSAHKVTMQPGRMPANPPAPVASGQNAGACSAYLPPTNAADSGLCARCGMFDYKHQEQPDA